MFANHSTSAKIGLIFASIALLTGSLFFVYSIKYYLTLAIVLSFSRHSLEDNLEPKTWNLKQRENGLFSWLGRIFGINISTNKKIKAKAHSSFLASSLQPNLDHIKLVNL